MSHIYKVEILDTNQVFPCKDTETLLTGMERARVNPFPVGCRGGGCGICKIQVVDGEIESEVMSRAHISVEDEQKGIILACRVKPRGDVKLKTVTN